MTDVEKCLLSVQKRSNLNFIIQGLLYMGVKHGGPSIEDRIQNEGV
jgi:hypothetical protein